MTDFVDKYRATTHKRLRSRRGKRLSSIESVSAVVEAVFFPSFHPEVLLQATKSETSELRLTSLTSSLWYSSEVSGNGPAPQQTTEKVTLEQGRSTEFWQQVEDLQPQSIPDAKTIGLDGMSVSAAYCTTEVGHAFSAWSPSRDSPQGRYVQLLYTLAWDTLHDETSIERLEQLHGYLDLGLCARVIDESPQRLRLFGSFSSGDEKELHAFFSGIPSDAPLVVDMTNFDGMGTILYPSFVSFAKAQKRLAWVGSPNAVRQLKELGIQERFICNSVDEARQRLIEGQIA